MKPEKFEISTTLNVNPEQLFNDWLNSEKHSAFTGELSTCSDQEGGKFQHSNGYIWGRNLELNHPNRILQSWRTKVFPESAENSFIEIFFIESSKGCRFKIKHSNIPEGQSKQYEQGWKDYYFKPMKEFYNSSKNDD